MKKRVVAKAQKKRRRNRQWYAELNGLHFEDRQPKDAPLPTSDDGGMIAMATILALVTNKRSRIGLKEPDLSAEQLRLQAIKRAKEAQGGQEKGT